jgi:phosphate transport system substrate-binding protein
VKPRMVLTVVTVWLAASALACGRPGRTERLVVTGSSTMAALVTEIGKRFESDYPSVRVDVQTGGSARGISDARRGLADVGMVSRSLKGSEADLHGFPIARDGIGIIVHRENPVSALANAQVVAIFTGAIGNWSELGGREAPITVVNKAEGRSTLELFLRHFGLQSTDIRASVVIGDNEHGIKTVAGDPAAIGYVSIGSAEDAVARGVPIRLLPMDGVEAKTGNVRNGTFPLSRELNLVTRDEPVGLAQQWIDYARSARVRDLVEELYFVPLAE